MRAILQYGEMQRRAVLFERAHLGRKQSAVFGQLPHEIAAVERDGREDRRLGAAREQMFGGRALHVLTGRPAR